MAGLFDTMVRNSSRLAETGLLLMDSTMRTMQSTIGRLAGQEPVTPPTAPPIDGPATLDDATSDLSNRLARIAWTMSLTPDDLGTALRDLWESPRRSFGAISFKDPRQWIAVPLQLPLSFGTLMIQQILRGLSSFYIVGPDHFPRFVSYMAESFTEIHVIMSLQYKEQLERLKETVRKRPDDAKGRLKLGKAYMKLGLYPEAIKELAIAADNTQVRADALRESSVARYRAGYFREAIQDCVGSLSIEPGDERTQYWLWLAAQKLGGYPPDVPEGMRVEVKAGRQSTRLQFEDVAREIGLDKTGAGRGTAVFDMDGDGYLDVVIASAHGGCTVYRNNGDGTFADVTVGSGLEECLNSFIVAVGDYNNDGLDDLFVTRTGFFPGESVLYRNNGDGTFTNVTKESKVSCWGPSFTAQWCDYDCDGNLDLFVANNLGGIFDRTMQNRLFHNNGDGTFTDVTRQAGIHTAYPTIGSAWGDYNNDGYPDLFLSSGVGRSQLYRNNGDGTFSEVSREAGVDQVSFGSITLWCDYDNDGWLDLVQFIWSPEQDVLHTMFHGEAPLSGHPMRIYHNNRNGTFTLRNRELGLNGCFGTMSGNIGDFNNDGYIDFLMGNGAPQMERTEPPTLFEYDPGQGKFKNTTFSAGLPTTGKGHGANLADLAGDGRLCLIVASGGAYPGDLLTTSVFRPTTLPGNYLNVRLVGTKSNRNAIGARIRLDAGGRSQHRLVNGGSSFGHLPFEQHFGLGDLRKVDVVEIRWPSGLAQRLANPPTNSTIRVVEGKDGWQEVYTRRVRTEPQPEVRAACLPAIGGDGTALPSGSSL